MSQDGVELIICDGGLPSLVACTLAAKRGETRGEPTTAIAWFVPTGDDTDDIRRNSVRAVSTLLGLSHGDAGVQSVDLSPGQRETRMLLDASAHAIDTGVPTVIWAIHPGGSEPNDWPDLDAISTRMDRALMCARLASLDASDPSTADIHIEVPLIDLTDRQLSELAADLGVAVETCWWWGGGESGAIEARRWKPLLEAAGLLAMPV